MSLFQKSVLSKYLRQLDDSIVKEAYQKFTEYFHNPERQANIRAANEEQFQEGFLRELFVKILGYTINPEPDYNLTTEFKNENGSKKADGAILSDDKAIGVIELKGTDTKDLDKINDQAFSYKNNQSSCTYVITSNFEKLRFFINNAVDHEEFNLFELTEDEFKLLWLCLYKINLLAGIPQKIKQESLLQEDKVTKQLYTDYSAFKRELWEDMVNRNPECDELVLFQKSQKLLDRFLFILFSEDKGLLPPNSISIIIEDWKKLKELDEYRPLYNRFKKYFTYMNLGFKGKKYEIHAYNGGLFQDDEVLDSVIIDDEVLHKHVMKLTEYDFDSEVDVNILGHIFEHSLSEIENVRAQLEGIAIDKTKTKRKKEGIFYTPKYITKYIVDNTVGKLCEEKKVSLVITEERFTEAGRRTKKGIKDLEDYREWLLGLKICDPACGSGAFLNQALQYLINEHSWLDELIAEYHGSTIVFPDVEKHILENNLYGVDINEESVEIAKLSLWLHTAQKGRKLTTLSNNIKCGNSLIDDPGVAGKNAFNWQNEFPEVFRKGGFDVVIGNPPYLRVQGLKTHFENESKYYENKYSCATRRYDIYSLFLEKSIDLINPVGRVSFILPHKFLVVDAGHGIRKFLSTNKVVESIIHFGEEMIFNDASTYTCIITLTKNNDSLYFKNISSSDIFTDEPFNNIDYLKLNENNWNLISNKITKVINKISVGNPTVSDVFSLVGAGIDAGVDDIFLMSGTIVGDMFVGFSDRLGKVVELEKELVKPLLKGEDVKRYLEPTPNKYILYPHYLDGKKTRPLEEEVFKRKFPLAYYYINSFKEEMIVRKKRKKTNPKYWYSLHRSREILSFEGKKIITPEISLGTNMVLDVNGYFHNTKVYYIIKRDNICEDYKYFLGILNSSIMWFYLKSIGYVLRGGYFTFKTKFLEPFPLAKPKNLEEERALIEKVEKISSNTKDLHFFINKFIKYLQSHFQLKTLSIKLQNWPKLDFGEFIKEINKSIKKAGGEKLSKMDEMEWMEVFETKKAETQVLKTEIDQIDKEIDQMVYELYGLTEEEIKIIEES